MLQKYVVLYYKLRIGPTVIKLKVDFQCAPNPGLNYKLHVPILNRLVRNWFVNGQIRTGTCHYKFTSLRHLILHYNIKTVRVIPTSWSKWTVCKLDHCQLMCMIFLFMYHVKKKTTCKLFQQINANTSTFNTSLVLLPMTSLTKVISIIG